MTRNVSDERVNPQGQVLSLISQMHRAAGDANTVRKLSDQMEVLVRSHMAPVYIDDFPGLRLTAAEARVMARLKSHAGEIVTYTALLDALYFDKALEADANILKVHVCHLRRKIKAENYPAIIETIYGVGYKLVDPEHERRQQAIYDRIQAS